MIRSSLIALTASLALAAGGSSALAQVGTAMTYQGQLKESGSAVNSATDMQFSLWDADSGGSQVGSTVEQLGVAVSQGLFTTDIDFGVNPYTTDQALWLQIDVRNPAGFGSYVPMGARQKLTPAPFSAATRGLNVNADDRIGILANPYPTNDVALTIGSAGSQGSNIMFLGAGSPWAINHYGGIPFGDFTIARVGADYPVVIKGNSSDIVLNRSSSGLVGIGTDTPSNRLSVAGNADVSGNFGIGTITPTNRLSVNGSANISGSVAAASFGGSGAALTGLNASNITTGNLAAGRLPVTGDWQLAGDLNVDNFTFYVAAISNNVGIGVGPGGGFKLDVAGNIRCVALTQTSSREFKQDIVPLTGALDSIMKLKGVTYAWNDQAPEQVRGSHDIGFLADEMNEVLPDIVAKDENGKPVGIDYGKITPVAVEAIKQLKGENDQLKARLEKIEALLAAQAENAAK